MHISEMVQLQLAKLPETIRSYIQDDIRYSRDLVTEQILNNNLYLEINWSNYTLADIHAWYIDDAMDLHNKLQLFDIVQMVGPINIKDTALISIYEYTYNDILGNIMYTAKMIHVLRNIKQQGRITHTYIFRAD